MKEERMFILTMVNEGKITAAEGVELLNALAATESSIDFDKLARNARTKAANFAEKAEPKVKRAAKGIKNKSVEVYHSIKGRFSDKAEEETAAAGNPDEYIEIPSPSLDDDHSERTQRDPEMARDTDTLPIEDESEE